MPTQLTVANCKILHLLVTCLVDLSDIYFFFCSGTGKRSSRRWGGDGFFSLKIPREGFQEGEGPRGREGVCGELGNFFGGGVFFVRGRNVHQG